MLSAGLLFFAYIENIRVDPRIFPILAQPGRSGGLPGFSGHYRGSSGLFRGWTGLFGEFSGTFRELSSGLFRCLPASSGFIIRGWTVSHPGKCDCYAQNDPNQPDHHIRDIWSGAVRPPIRESMTVA